MPAVGFVEYENELQFLVGAMRTLQGVPDDLANPVLLLPVAVATLAARDTIYYSAIWVSKTAVCT